MVLQNWNFFSVGRSELASDGCVSDGYGKGFGTVAFHGTDDAYSCHKYATHDDGLLFLGVLDVVDVVSLGGYVAIFV